MQLLHCDAIASGAKTSWIRNKATVSDDTLGELNDLLGKAKASSPEGIDEF